MEPTDVLGTVAEIAVAFAGFSGLVATLGRREQGALFTEDRVRLAVLLGASLSTTAFALLPARAEDPEVIERASAAALKFSTYVGFPGVLALQCANVFLGREFTPFLAALLWGLVGCAIGIAGLVRAQYR